MEATEAKNAGRVAGRPVMFAVRLGRDQSERLSSEARRRNVTQAMIVREAVDRYLDETVR